MDSLLRAMGLKNIIIVNKIAVLQKQVLHLIYLTDKKEHAIPLFINAKIIPITILYHEAVCKLMLDLHNNSAPSNIMKRFVRTLNNYTYILLAHQHHNLLGLSTLGVKIWNEMLNEWKILSKKSFKKETKRLFCSNILETEDSYFKPDEIMV